MTTIEPTDDGDIMVRIPMSLRNYSGRKKLIIVSGEFDPTKILENTITSMKADYRSRLFLTKYGTAADDRPA